MAAKLPDLPLIEPANRHQWREWLEQNHATAPGVWLAVGKKGNSVTSLTYEEAVEEALAFGWIDSVVNRLDEHRFKQAFTPRRPGSIWARSNKQRIERLEAAGRMAPAGIAVVRAAKADGSWESLDEVESLVMPDDLAAALSLDPRAVEGFASLSASARKMTLYYIAEAKRPETRARRIAQTVSSAIEGRPPR